MAWGLSKAFANTTQNKPSNQTNEPPRGPKQIPCVRVLHTESGSHACDFCLYRGERVRVSGYPLVQGQIHWPLYLHEHHVAMQDDGRLKDCWALQRKCLPTFASLGFLDVFSLTPAFGRDWISYFFECPDE